MADDKKAENPLDDQFLAPSASEQKAINEAYQKASKKERANKFRVNFVTKTLMKV